MIAGATIRSAGWAKLAPFAVGETLKSVRTKMGAVASEDDYLRYEYSGESESIRFETRAGKLAGILYACYTG